MALEALPPQKGGGGDGWVWMAARDDGRLLALAPTGVVVQNAPSGIGSVRRVRRAGGGLALLSPDRIVLLDMARRGGQRECALPESLAADGAELVDFAFDAQVPQLLYAATSTGLTIVFNTKLRRQVAKEAAAAPPEGGGVGHARRGAASPPECRGSTPSAPRGPRPTRARPAARARSAPSAATCSPSAAPTDRSASTL